LPSPIMPIVSFISVFLFVDPVKPWLLPVYRFRPSAGKG